MSFKIDCAEIGVESLDVVNDQVTLYLDSGDILHLAPVYEGVMVTFNDEHAVLYGDEDIAYSVINDNGNEYSLLEWIEIQKNKQ